jgi:class 3 adenylate cyclase
MSSSRQIRPQASSCHDDPLAALVELALAVRPAADAELIRRAYEVAAYWHQGQTRRSGDPYITHPLAVAMILAETGADDQMLCAALLHDTIGYTGFTPAALSRQFGAEITALVAGVTALDRIRGRHRRKVARATAAARSADARVLAIKLADRLHNMRTVQFIPQAKQLRKAREAVEIFVPVASRLSMNAIESELQALAAATMKRHRHAGSLSGRLLIAMTALLPAGSRTRWCEEWLGELHTLPGRRDRASFAIHTLLGVPRLAFTVRKATPGGASLMARVLPRAGLLPLPGMPCHRAIVAVDIEQSTSRPDPVKAELRTQLYELFDKALHAAGIQQRNRDRFTDRGDGILALIHPVDQAPKAILLTTAIPALCQLLTDYNARLPRGSRPQRQLRVRVVVHAGEVSYDPNGCFGEALDIAFRLLDAAHVKKALRMAAGPLALVISGDIYRAVVRHGYDGIDPAAFHPLTHVNVAGHRYPGWVYIPRQGTANQVTDIATYRQPA